MSNEKVYGMAFAKVYPMLIAKAERKGRTRITRGGCGVRVETAEEPLMREMRYLDKLVDELAKGKSMEKILRG